MAQVDSSTNFLNRISDTQNQLTRCKDLLVAIWHQELDGATQPRVKLQMRMIEERLNEVEDILKEGIIQ